MIRMIITGFLMTLCCVAMGQSWQLQMEVKCGQVEKLTVDQVGNYYVTNVQGEVSKYSPEGELVVEYAPQQVARIHEIVAPTQFKVLLFYKDLQEVVVLNRYLSNPLIYRLPDYDLGYIEDVAPNLQQALWVLDISDFALKLIDFRENRLLEQKSLAQILDQNLAEIVAFHSHQNRMYVIDKTTGVHVFDNIGNYLYKLLDLTPLRSRFYKDYLYYQDEGQLSFIHLYEGDNFEQSLHGLELTNPVYFKDRLAGITPRGFNIYQYLSGQ